MNQEILQHNKSIVVRHGQHNGTVLYTFAFPHIFVFLVLVLQASEIRQKHETDKNIRKNMLLNNFCNLFEFKTEK